MICRLCMFWVWAVAFVGSGAAWAFSVEDIQRLEAAEQQELLALARQSAERQAFDQARHYIEQARHKGYSPQAIEAAEGVYQRAYATYEARLRQAREADAVQRQGPARVASGRPAYVMVYFEVVGGMQVSQDLHLSGGPGRFSPAYSGASSGAIHPGYKEQLAGRYQWSGRSREGRTVCSGQVELSGLKPNLRIAVYSDNCRDAGSREY